MNILSEIGHEVILNMVFPQAILIIILKYLSKFEHTNCHLVRCNFYLYELLDRPPTSLVFFAPARERTMT